MDRKFEVGDRVKVTHEAGTETGTVFNAGPNDPKPLIRFDDNTFASIHTSRMTRVV